MNTRAFVGQQTEDKLRSPDSWDAQSAQGTTDPERYWRAEAKARAQSKDYSSAIAILTQLIDRNPDSAADYNNRGLIYFQSGQLERALEDYNIALQLNPKLASIYNNRANYYAACGKIVEAVADYEVALDLDPSNIRAWINLGITFRDLGLYQRAIENFDFALILGQFAGNVYAERGRTYHLWGEWNCAIADYQRALVQLPQPSYTTPAADHRLRLQVEIWLDDLLSPLEV